jgi:hypothetical protein
MSQAPTKIKIYWDTQDRANEGWAYESSNDDGTIESGAVNDSAWGDLDPNATRSQLQDAVVLLSYCAGITIDCGDVAIDEAGGLSAHWTAEASQ